MSLYDELVAKINTIKRSNRNIITNAFFTAQQLKSMIDSNRVSVRISDEAVIILVEEEQLIRLYFYAANFDSLRQAKDMLTSYSGKAIIADIIGKKPGVVKLINELQKLNFFKYNELIRMSRLPQEFIQLPQKFTQINISDIIVATPDKCNEIVNMLYAEFDIYISHLPTKEKILKSIANKEIMIAIHQGKVVGLTYVETLGERSKYIYQTVIDKDFRGKGIADRFLIYTFENSSKDTCFQLWVETDNHRSINKHKKYNFVADGLIDYIMIYKGE